MTKQNAYTIKHLLINAICDLENKDNLIDAELRQLSKYYQAYREFLDQEYYKDIK